MRKFFLMCPAMSALAMIAVAAPACAATPAVLVTFCAQTNCADGAQPRVGLNIDAQGNLFGTTNAGGANNQGTLFALPGA